MIKLIKKLVCEWILDGLWLNKNSHITVVIWLFEGPYYLILIFYRGFQQIVFCLFRFAKFQFSELVGKVDAKRSVRYLFNS